MKIIFLGTTGVHHSLIAANMYLNHLNKSDFRFVEGYCDTDKDRSGFPIFIDEDENANKVYCIGVGREIEVGQKTIEELVHLLGYSSRDLLVKPVSIRGENLLYFLGKIPKILLGNYFNFIISNYVLKKEFKNIQKDVEEFKTEINTPTYQH